MVRGREQIHRVEPTPTERGHRETILSSVRWVLLKLKLAKDSLWCLKRGELPSQGVDKPTSTPSYYPPTHSPIHLPLHPRPLPTHPIPCCHGHHHASIRLQPEKKQQQKVHRKFKEADRKELAERVKRQAGKAKFHKASNHKRQAGNVPRLGNCSCPQVEFHLQGHIPSSANP